MKANKNTIMLVLAVIILPFVLFVAAKDVLQLKKSCDDQNQWPWYSTSWLLHPVTNMIMITGTPTEMWTYNAIRSEHWYIREVNFCGKGFWTILEKMPNIELPASGEI